MSAQPEERPAIELPDSGDLAFNALMDALAPEAAGAPEGGSGTAGAVAPGDAPGGAVQQPQAPAPGNAAPPAGGADASGTGTGKTGPSGDGEQQPPVGTADGSAQQPAADSQGTDLPGDWTADATKVIPQLGTLSTTIEENLVKAYQTTAYNTAREEYEKYFEALEKHPRLLIGTQVPAIGKEGMETLRDSKDAAEWQEAVKQLLVQEIKENAQIKFDESRDILETVHASIDLFKNNPDLIPRTKGFNRKLADAFAKMATPYEVRADGKLQGYSIPVQPIIDNLRAQLTVAAPIKTPATTPPPADPPQAGIPSKSASSSDKEDFSTLFGTIGLPNLVI